MSTRAPTVTSQLEDQRSQQSLSESPYYTSTIDIAMKEDRDVSAIAAQKLEVDILIKNMNIEQDI